MVTAELEGPRPLDGPDASDAVTFSFGDAATGVYGLARAGRAAHGASGLAVLFHEGRTVAVRAEGGAGEDAAGVIARVVAPLERWEVSFDGGADGGFALEVEALGHPAEISAESAVGAAGAMEGYEHLCHVRGTARVGDRGIAIDCLGQRGHQWGAPDWERMALARTIGAWLEPDLGVVLSAVRPAKAREHDGEAVTAAVLEGAPVAPLAIAEPLLSTSYDGERRQRRAGFELWPAGDDAYARRGAGEVVCGTSLDLGRLRLDCAFFRWRMEGHEGVGRYDVLRRA